MAITDLLAFNSGRAESDLSDRGNGEHGGELCLMVPCTWREIVLVELQAELADEEFSMGKRSNSTSLENLNLLQTRVSIKMFASFMEMFRLIRRSLRSFFPRQPNERFSAN